MRIVPLVLLASVAASCSYTGAPPPMAERTPQQASKLAALTAGRVAGPPLSCLPSFRSGDMRVIDESTVAFRDGARVYVNHMQGGCANLNGSTTLVTRSGGTGLCRGDIAQVVDPLSSIPVGSCAFGDFIPYTRPRA
ncbi:MAG TPA: hypothetical protein VM308_00790 [Sphingomicrobium sp.]|nr:hypothetical protein [Sphingomicrobium sp.]